MGIGLLLIVAALLAGDLDLSNLTRAEVAARGENAFAEGVRRHDDPDAARGLFRSAAACFDELRRRGASNPTLYRNLGHSYLLAGDLPRAILSYRRGLRLAPDDRELNVGLHSARERVTYPAGSRLGRPESDGQSPWPKWFRAEWVVAAAIVLYSVACLGLTRWLMTRRGALLAAALTALLGAGLLTALAVRGMASAPMGPIIVISDDGVLLRRGDSLSYPPRYETPINRGVEGQVLVERGRWLQIELLGGEVGWVMRDYVLMDEEAG